MNRTRRGPMGLGAAILFLCAGSAKADSLTITLTQSSIQPGEPIIVLCRLMMSDAPAQEPYRRGLRLAQRLTCRLRADDGAIAEFPNAMRPKYRSLSDANGSYEALDAFFLPDLSQRPARLFTKPGTYSLTLVEDYHSPDAVISNSVTLAIESPNTAFDAYSRLPLRDMLNIPTGDPINGEAIPILEQFRNDHPDSPLARYAAAAIALDDYHKHHRSRFDPSHEPVDWNSKSRELARCAAALPSPSPLAEQLSIAALISQGFGAGNKLNSQKAAELRDRCHSAAAVETLKLLEAKAVANPPAASRP